MAIIIFLYVVGYLVAVGVGLYEGDFKHYHPLIILIGLLIMWPVVLGAVLVKR